MLEPLKPADQNYFIPSFPPLIGKTLTPKPAKTVHKPLCSQRLYLILPLNLIIFRKKVESRSSPFV
jgi:hypothetical protein